MLAETRRILALVLSVALAVGLATHGIGKQDMGMKSAIAAAIDMPMPPASHTPKGKCDGFGDGQKGMASPACDAYCGGTVALPVVALVVELIAVGVLGPSDDQAPTSHAPPPDPYPPRPTILS